MPHQVCGLENILVIIVKEHTYEPAGMGFYYNEDAIITCSSIVENALPGNNTIHFYFPYLQNRNLIRGTIHATHYKKEEGCFYDIAVITITGKVPVGAQPVQLTHMDIPTIN